MLAPVVPYPRMLVRNSYVPQSTHDLIIPQTSTIMVLVDVRTKCKVQSTVPVPGFLRRGSTHLLEESHHHLVSCVKLHKIGKKLHRQSLQWLPSQPFQLW